MFVTTKKTIFLFFFLFLNLLVHSQDTANKWVVGIGVNAVDYYPTDEDGMGGFFNEISNSQDHWNIYGPKLNVSRFLTNKLNADVSFSLNKITKLGDITNVDLMYYALDANLHYNFLGNENRFVPFLVIGAGYNWVEGFNSAGTINAGFGANYWLSEKIAINMEAAYKYNSPDYKLMSHFQYGLSVLFKLNSSNRSGWNGNGIKCYK